MADIGIQSVTSKSKVCPRVYSLPVFPAILQWKCCYPSIKAKAGEAQRVVANAPAPRSWFGRGDTASSLLTLDIKLGVI